MALIKEPLDVDFVVEPHSLTDLEKLAISEYIKNYKKKNKKKTPLPLEELAAA